MEEKERFELFGEHCIKDNNPDARPQLFDACVACVILNEQDKKIKAKEKEANTYAKEIAFLDNKIKQLKEKLNNFETCMKKYNVEDIEHLDLMLFVLSGETKYHLKEIKDKHKKELKQSQKQLAIEELEMFRAILSRAVLWDNDYECWTIGDEVYDSLMEQIDDKIKELKGEE